MHLADKNTQPESGITPQAEESRQEISEILLEQIGAKDDITWLVGQVWQLRDEVRALQAGYAHLEKRLDDAGRVIASIGGGV